jgi:RNA polymerase sigma-70 factor (ECF subfamily)
VSNRSAAADVHLDVPSTGTADDEALRALVAEHSGALLAYVQRQVGDRGRAEDLVQEVFVRAWRRAGTFDPSRGQLRGWLFAIARNLVTDAYRADAARPRTVGDESLLARAPADDDLAAALDSWTMAEALRRLTPAHRQVVVQLYYRRLSVAEAAAESGVPVGTVKSRSTYALRALRLALEELDLLEERA